MKLSFAANFYHYVAGRRHVILAIFLSVTFYTLAAGNFYAAAPVPAITPPNWYFTINDGELFDHNPTNTQWLVLENQLTALTLEQDQINIFTADERFNWITVQSLKPSEAPVSAFTVSDINNDGVPEIISGTAEPGYIFIYNLNNGQWTLNHYEKYVWSTITQIAAGNFDGLQTYFLVQNQEGFLYLLRLSNDSLDIIWKSPAVWRQISYILVLDIDRDSKDEIIVYYKTGGIGVLKLVNNQIVSVWDNFLWGKALAFTAGDWDNDRQPEILISTSQKVIYVLGITNKNYVFEGRITHFDYIAETLCLVENTDEKLLFSTDTAGKLHCYKYDAQAKQWLEQFFCQTGRITRMIATSHPDTFLLWSLNRKLMALTAFKCSRFKLKLQETLFELTPPALFQNNIVYIAPKALSQVAALGINYHETKTAFTVNTDQTVLEVVKNEPRKYKLNNEIFANFDQLLIADNNLYFSCESYLKLLNMTLTVEPLNQTITIVPAQLIKVDPGEASPQSENPDENP